MGLRLNIISRISSHISTDVVADAVRAGSDGLTTDNGIEHFAAVNGHLFGSFNTQTDFVTTDLYHNDREIVVDDDALISCLEKMEAYLFGKILL